MNYFYFFLLNWKHLPSKLSRVSKFTENIAVWFVIHTVPCNKLILYTLIGALRMYVCLCSALIYTYRSTNPVSLKGKIESFWPKKLNIWVKLTRYWESNWQFDFPLTGKLTIWLSISSQFDSNILQLLVNCPLQLLWIPVSNSSSFGDSTF